MRNIQILCQKRGLYDEKNHLLDVDGTLIDYDNHTEVCCGRHSMERGKRAPSPMSASSRSKAEMSQVPGISALMA